MICQIRQTFPLYGIILKEFCVGGSKAEPMLYFSYSTARCQQCFVCKAVIGSNDLHHSSISCHREIAYSICNYHFMIYHLIMGLTFITFMTRAEAN